MKIKRFLVEEKEYVMGEIESFLCRQGISHVKVENEIHCPDLILRFYDFDNFKLETLELLGILQGWDPLDGMNRKSTSDCLIVIGEELPFAAGLHNKDTLLEVFTRPQIKEFIPVPPKKAAPSPYPVPKNKKKQLQMENQRYMKKLK